MRTRRIISLLLAITLIATAAMSAVFIIEYADHDCAGSECPVCVELKACLKTLGDVSAVLLAACAAVYLILSAGHRMVTRIPYVVRLSPVNLCDKITA